jgi:hypothetical protein
MTEEKNNTVKNVQENTRVKNLDTDNKIMTVFYIQVPQSIENYKDIVKKVLENIKNFSTENNIIVKYNYIENAVDKQFQQINGKTVEIKSDHIYFKLNYNNLGLFKKHQKKCSCSRYITMAHYTPKNDEEKQKLLKVKNSFVKITEQDNKLLFKSRTTQNSHYYLSRQIFNENEILMTNKTFKYVEEVVENK